MLSGIYRQNLNKSTLPPSSRDPYTSLHRIKARHGKRARVKKNYPTKTMSRLRPANCNVGLGLEFYGWYETLPTANQYTNDE